MALVKNATPAQDLPSEVVAEANEVFGDTNTADTAYIQSTAIAPAASTEVSTSVRGAALSGTILDQLAGQGFEGLAFDWTSFSSISLKNEGVFEDFDGNNYGKEILCRIRGSKERIVYRGNPVMDNKRDLAFTYDGVMTQSGVRIDDKIAEWEAQGKMVDRKVYLEVLVELVDEGGPDDGEYRILSISPTSKGRFTGHVARAAALGGGDPGNVISKVMVGPKVTKVQNPYYPWAFEIVK